MKNNQLITNSRYVMVRAPARLHMGFLDMHGGLGRKFGSLGLSISEIETSLVIEYADDVNVIGPSAERASHYARQLLSHFGINGGVKISINSAIPEHIGLGSGTQLSLAIAAAIARLYDLPEQNTRHLAAILHRGARSGIGIGTFMNGGFVVDGGRGEHTEVPPVVSHLLFPEHWRIILIFDDDAEGINGVPERHAFNTLAPLPQSMSGLLSRLTLMQVLPAICENDCGRFGEAITEIQNITGDYFSQAQEGRYTSIHLKSILDSLVAKGATGMGQSSWGPTGFVFFPDERMAFQTLRKIQDEWQSQSSLRFMICKACNTGALVEVSTKKPATLDENLKINTI